ncbi:hypothetical protein F1737_08505 [Methanoplanus sp. FWC-SCC4]|uniref:Uncharacterized protein n=1 Tax=Methanochimaera problematica TaxID=2609417 RepID=A0AA97FDV4_9EURY|nr:hypothetical protein [Methanoplanus sp. FWC-SCC4]WOF16727.1 hypothetical protein F1737_08505 [Methanoplanus sp. FWC-SCC4]
MNKWFFTLIIIASTVIFTSGCLGSGDDTPVAEKTAGFDAFSANKSVDDKIYLKDAIKILNYSIEDGFIEGGNITYHQIMGSGADESGAADFWIIGIKREGKPSLLSYSRTGWEERDWPGPMGDSIIIMDEIILPKELYSKNQAEIIKLLNETGTTEVILKDGRYRISGSGQSISTTADFDSITGDVI